MAETALKFGPEWLRALSHGNSVTSPPPSPALTTKYKLADYRYGREEMLALFSKDLKIPECLKEFHFIAAEKCQLPLALLPVTEEEQRIWARSVNSDVALRSSGKGSGGPGNGASRSGRGGSVDRGRGRGRGVFFQRGVSFEDGEDGPPGNFSRPRPVERSQSANEKDQRWDDRERRYDRNYIGRGGGVGTDDSSNNAKQDGTRAPVDNWRRLEKNDDDGGWRTAGVRGIDKHGNRGSWRNNIERDRNRDEFEKTVVNNHASIPNGPTKSVSHHPNQRHPPGGLWEDDPSGKNRDGLPEWSMDEPVDTDVVGSFDSSGAFMESKAEDSFNSDEIYASDEGNVLNESAESESPITAPKSPMNKFRKSASESTVKSPKKANLLPTSKTRVSESPNYHRTGENVSRSQNHHENDKSDSNVILLPNVFEESSIPRSENVVKPDVPQKMPTITQRKCAIGVQLQPHTSEVSSAAEEDAFAHHKKATENMMAQWTEEEEQRIISNAADRIAVLPPHHEDAHKWYYRDPQGEIQGPFSSSEMLEWFQSGYFTMNLMVRRGCDDTFSQLGELMNIWGNVPFLPGVTAPPIRMASITTAPTTPFTQSAVLNPPPPAHQPKPDAQLRVLQQQLIQQQLMQQQLLLRQAQFQQIVNQLKSQETFSTLPPQQQYEVLVRQLLAQSSLLRPGIGPIGDQPTGMEPMPAVPLPLLGLTMPPLLKSDFSLWGMPPAAGPWQVGVTNTGPSANGGIWDSEVQTIPPQNKDIEEVKKKRIEEEEKVKVEEIRRLEEESKRREEEERQRQDELRRKLEEERLRLELQKREEEEKKKLDELKKKKEEERRIKEELKRIEEQKKKEEEKRKQEELRQLEEKRKHEEEEERRKRETQRKKEEQEELRRLEELQKQEEMKKEEERKRQEEMRRQLELKRQEEIKKKEDAAKLEEKRYQEEIQHQKRLLKEREYQELERQKEIEIQQEKERQREMEIQKEIEKNHKLREQKFKPQGPVWGGIQNNTLPSSSLSLTDIQRSQEENEREEREEKLRQLQIQQQAMKAVAQNKNGPGSWGKRSSGSTPMVLSLAEIQQEEADKIAQHMKINKPKVVANSSVTLNSGVWGNSASHHIGMTSTPNWNACDVANSGFWDDVVNTNTARKSSKTNDSAFPALSSSLQPASTNSNKSKNVRAKKEEESVMRLFESHRKATDEFTTWCTDALSNLPSSLDVPTFVAFLKDVESPYEVMDYVRSYLGETKEAREFGSQFLERRSRFRNQAKQTPAEENMWGPAPAITPVNKPPNLTANDCDGHTGTKGKPKRKRNRMQKVDNSMLGFTVQSNPDRINVGEIDHVEGM